MIIKFIPPSSNKQESMFSIDFSSYRPVKSSYFVLINAVIIFRVKYRDFEECFSG